MKDNYQVLYDLVKSRYATKVFDGKEVQEEKIQKILELVRLAPSSFNIQPWKIVIVKDRKLKEELKKASYNQEQITSCSHLLVFCADTDTEALINKIENDLKNKLPKEKLEAYLNMLRGFVQSLDKNSKLAWLQKQVYIAAENAMLAAKALDLDSCPMEGFEPDKYKKILQLNDNLVPTVLVPVGYAKDKAKEKYRFDLDFITIKK
ncbi:MAG: NAD(P)H-dependent oxidoreductase [Candidatus Micrarchaeota archaeon]|nr:NAD(P)H-dependent oxidoreductase [Candidatus Micrarchaeota archaeon]